MISVADNTNDNDNDNNDKANQLDPCIDMQDFNFTIIKVKIINGYIHMFSYLVTLDISI